MSRYSKSIQTTKDIEEKKDEAVAEVGSKAVETQSFVLDKKIKLDELLKKAAKKFGTAKSIGAMIGGGIALATGAAPLAAAAWAAAGTIGGGLWGQAGAKNVMKDFGWMNKTQSDLFAGMRKQTGKEAMINAVLAGVTAKGAGEANVGTEAGKTTKTGVQKFSSATKPIKLDAAGKAVKDPIVTHSQKLATKGVPTQAVTKPSQQLRQASTEMTVPTKVRGAKMPTSPGPQYKSIFASSKPMGTQAMENLKAAGTSLFSNATDITGAYGTSSSLMGNKSLEEYYQESLGV